MNWKWWQTALWVVDYLVRSRHLFGPRALNKLVSQVLREAQNGVTLTASGQEKNDNYKEKQCKQKKQLKSQQVKE